MDPAHLIRNGPARPSRARELVTSRRARARACSTATVSSRASGSTLGHRMLVRPAGHRNRVLLRPRLERSPPGRRALAWPHAVACSRGRGWWLEQSSWCIQMKRNFQLDARKVDPARELAIRLPRISIRWLISSVCVSLIDL